MLKQGRDFDPHLRRDVLMGVIDGPGAEAHLARRILDDRAKKVKGVRINSRPTKSHVMKANLFW